MKSNQNEQYSARRAEPCSGERFWLRLLFNTICSRLGHLYWRHSLAHCASCRWLGLLHYSKGNGIIQTCLLNKMQKAGKDLHREDGFQFIEFCGLVIRNNAHETRFQRRSLECLRVTSSDRCTSVEGKRPWRWTSHSCVWFRSSSFDRICESEKRQSERERKTNDGTDLPLCDALLTVHRSVALIRRICSGQSRRHSSHVSNLSWKNSRVSPISTSLPNRCTCWDNQRRVRANVGPSVCLSVCLFACLTDCLSVW